MKKFLSATLATITAALALTITAPAAPLDTNGIPAAAVGVLHIDFDALAKTPFNAPIQTIVDDLSTALAADTPDEKKFQEKTDFNEKTDLHGITIGIMGADETERKTAEEEKTKSKKRHHRPTGIVVLLRGKFSTDKWNAYLRELHPNSKNSVNIGKYKVYLSGHCCVSLINETTLLLGVPGGDDCGTEEPNENRPHLNAIFSALDNPAKSRPSPPSLQTFGKEVGTPLMLGYFDLAALEFREKTPEDFPWPDSIQAALGETNGTLKFRATSKHTNEADAQTYLARVQLTMVAARVSLAAQIKQLNKRSAASNKDKRTSSATPTAALEQIQIKLQKALLQEAAKFLDNHKLTTRATNTNLSADLPAAPILALLADLPLLQKAQSKLEEQIQKESEERIDSPLHSTDAKDSTSSIKNEPPPPPVKPDYSDLNYRLLEGDVLSIRCIEDNSIDKQYVISVKGEIDLPHLNQVKIAGKTTHEIRDLLAKRFKDAKLHKNPHFNVNVIAYAPRSILVAGFAGRGSVEVPFYVNKNNTFLQTMTYAGGVSPRGNPRDVLLFRLQPKMTNGKPSLDSDGKPVMERHGYRIDWTRILKNYDADFELAEDDYILIKEDYK